MIFKEGKVLFVIQYQFNVLVSSPLASINTNCTLLASSSSSPVKVTESTNDSNLKPGMKAYTTSGKEKFMKKLYIQCISVKICILIYLKNGKILQRYLLKVQF